jgi:hypothetical protein
MQATDNTLQLDSLQCSHTTRIKEWKYELIDGNMKQSVALYDCKKCGLESTEPFKSEEVFVDHTKCGPKCFGCKARSIQMNAGDAKGAIIEGGMTQKKWDKELDAYKSARAQGIQPKSTRMKDITEAVDISNKVGKAYDASSPTGGII